MLYSLENHPFTDIINDLNLFHGSCVKIFLKECILSLKY